MENECNTNIPSIIKIEVADSQCHLMPKGNILILEGPIINYSKSGPVCITALNSIYPWVMVSRFDVKTTALDFDTDNDCYHCVCPCGIVHFDIQKITSDL